MYKLHNIFPTPILHFAFSKHKEYFFEDIQKSERVPPGWNCSINSSYPFITKNDLFINKKKAECLKNDLLLEIKELFKSSNIPSNISFNGGLWYNIYHKNQNQERHNHLNTHNGRNFWSGIYYNKNSSPTTFYPLSLMHRTSKFDGYENSIVKDSFYDYVNIDVNDGDVIIFPPYLEHEVILNKNFSDEMRVTFSFNIIMK